MRVDYRDLKYKDWDGEEPPYGVLFNDTVGGYILRPFFFDEDTGVVGQYAEDQDGNWLRNADGTLIETWTKYSRIKFYSLVWVQVDRVTPEPADEPITVEVRDAVQ